ncbi:hypothetical protein TNCV_1141901, partial [Trichonephila clavipes]
AARHHLIHGPVLVRGPDVADHCQRQLEKPHQTVAPHTPGLPTSTRDCGFNKCIHKEAHFLGFPGRAAAYKPFITKSNHSARLRWY